MIIQRIRKLAKQYGWKEEKAKDPTLLIFNRITEETHQQLNIWYTRMTVGTSLEHPKKGKTQLFRRNVSETELEKLFDNPRTHTRKGYYTK